MVYAEQIAVTLYCTETGANQSDAEAWTNSSTNLIIPFTPKLLPRKGIAHPPAAGCLAFLDRRTAPAGLTVSNLTQALPSAWPAQEKMLGLR